MADRSVAAFVRRVSLPLAAAVALGVSPGVAVGHSILGTPSGVVPLSLADQFGDAFEAAAARVPRGTPGPEAARLLLGLDLAVSERAMSLAAAILDGRTAVPWPERIGAAVPHLVHAAASGALEAGRLACALTGRFSAPVRVDGVEVCTAERLAAIDAGVRAERRVETRYRGCRARGGGLAACLRLVERGSGAPGAPGVRYGALGRVEAAAGRWDAARMVWARGRERGDLASVHYDRFGVPPSPGEEHGEAVAPRTKTLIVAAAGGFVLGMGPADEARLPWHPWSETVRAFEAYARSGQAADIVRYPIIRLGAWRDAAGYPGIIVRCAEAATGGIVVDPALRARQWRLPTCDVLLDEPGIDRLFDAPRWGDEGVETLAWLVLVHERTREVEDLTGRGALGDSYAHLLSESLLAPLWATRPDAVRVRVLDRARALDRSVGRFATHVRYLDPAVPMLRPAPEAVSFRGPPARADVQARSRVPSAAP